MIIEFIGCPRSGKTTTAARVFANLKEAGFNCEFIPEQARFYIAQKRAAQHLDPKSTLVLDDIDQRNIMEKQFNAQELMLSSCGKDALIVTDSSVVNSLLYMTKDGRLDLNVAQILEEYQKTPKVTFYSRPVEWIGGLDPNRVHTKEQSEAIDKEIHEYLFLGSIVSNPVHLIGDADMRWRYATSEVFRIIMEK